MWVNGGISKMWVTLYTDASWRPYSSKGTWAIWLRSNQGRIIENGFCADYVNCSVSAEAYAAYMGIVMAITNWKDIEGIQLNTDSRPIQGLLYPSKNGLSSNKIIAKLQVLIRTEVKDNKIKLRIKYVRGHQHDNDIRTYLNNKVDELTRQL